MSRRVRVQAACLRAADWQRGTHRQTQRSRELFEGGCPTCLVSPLRRIRLRASTGPLWNTELFTNLLFVESASLGDIGPCFGDRFTNSRLRQPEQGLLKRFPFVSADQDRGRR